MELLDTKTNDLFGIAQNLKTQLNPIQTAWLSGYLMGISEANLKTAGNNVAPALIDSALQGSKKEISILYGTHSGNSKSLAAKAKLQFENAGFSVKISDMADYKTHSLKDEKNLLIIISTHGEGTPPVLAEDFYNFLHSKRAPKLPGLNFSVLALGDKSYVNFCKTGADIDKRLEELGSTRLVSRVDCDTDFASNAENWIETCLQKFGTQTATNGMAQLSLNGNGHGPALSEYSRTKPFQASILEKIKLNGRGSAKETWHVELSLESSGITYQPGDALGVIPKNPEQLVEDVVTFIGADSNVMVETYNGATNYKDALQNLYELSLITADNLKAHNEFVNSEALASILSDTNRLKEYIYGRDILDVLQEFPYKYSAQQFVSILRKLTPRLYSIASSSLEHPNEVHVTVGAVRYKNGQRNRNGVCSTFFADGLNIDDSVGVFIEHNEGFRLPANPEAPIIMIGPGTGIAPFRAFVEERAASGAKGKSWLFFGDQHFTSDFLYQAEWLNYKKKGLLTKLDVAFSRDQDEKIYVQHRIAEHAIELINWIEQGAHIYVCGDKDKMAKDVENTFIEIVSKHKNLDTETAKQYIKDLRKQRRYAEDVY